MAKPAADAPTFTPRRIRKRSLLYALIVLMVVIITFTARFLIVRSLMQSYVYSFRSFVSSDEFSQWEVDLFVPELTEAHERLTRRQRGMNENDSDDEYVYRSRFNTWTLLSLLRDRSGIADAYIRERCAAGDLFEDEQSDCEDGLL